MIAIHSKKKLILFHYFIYEIITIYCDRITIREIFIFQFLLTSECQQNLLHSQAYFHSDIIYFVKRPLQIEVVNRLNDVLSGPQGDGFHWGVLVTTIEQEKFLIHKERKPTLTFEPFNDEENQISIIQNESRNRDQLIRDVTIKELINAAQEIELKEYDILTNNCIHAQNKIKTFINSLLRDESNIPLTDIAIIKQTTQNYSCRFGRKLGKKLTQFFVCSKAYIKTIKLHYSGLSVKEIFSKFFQEDLIHFGNQILKFEFFSKLFSKEIFNIDKLKQIMLIIKKDMKNNCFEQLCGFLGSVIAEGGSHCQRTWTEWFQQSLLALGTAVLSNFFLVQAILLFISFLLVLFYDKFTILELIIRFTTILTPLFIVNSISKAKVICYYLKFTSDYIITLYNKYCKTKEAVWKDPCVIGGSLGLLTVGAAWVVGGEAIVNSALLATATGGSIVTFPLTSLVIMGLALGIGAGAIIREIKRAAT